jgi:hypothetical protein
MSMRLDRSDWIKKMMAFKNKHPSMVQRILLKTADQVKIDADEIEPKTPHLEGQLRGNYQIKALKAYIIMIWFLMPYAARWHEAVNDIDPITERKINWSETGVGAKYLEKKLLTLGQKYGELMAALHRAEVNRA